MEREGIDYFNPAIVMAFLMVAMSDAAFLTFFFWFVPVVGLMLGVLVVGFHYFASFFLLFLILPKLKHLIPKIVLFIVLVLPLPLLSVGILVALLLQNRLIEALAIEAATQVVAGALAATGAGVPAAAAVEAGGQAAAAGTKAVEAGAAIAETGVAAAEIGAEAKVAETGAAAGKTALEAAPREITEPAERAPERKPSEVPEAEKEAKKPEVPKEALGEELTPLENLQKLFEETPREEGKPKSEEEEEGEEELPKAA
ncbi:hypothetical protein HY406_00095 [Candidatus Giovannonibacteria bacterium]|nr:hypothetical protein [Candidatus Giovannonibacteria bacterium]